jgi:hypothetical protein
MLDWLKRLLKHKCEYDLTWHGEIFYRRILIFQCKRCKQYCYVTRFAFMKGSGALTHILNEYIKEDKDYPDWDKKRINKNIYKFLSQYFQINNNKIFGLCYE